MKIISRGLLARIRRVLIAQVGDHRQCPHCGKGFIPRDPTADEAWALLVTMFIIKNCFQKGRKT
jgi:hypothetical protein